MSTLRTRRDRAVVLIMVMWMVILLSLMVYSLIFQVSTEATMTSARKKRFKAEMLAQAGVAKAIVDLQNDMIYDSAEEGKAFDAEGDVWARPEEDKMEVSLERRSENEYYDVRVYDEEGLFNLNRFSAQNMVILEKIIEKIGYNEEDAKLVAAAIVDWRDGDVTPVLPNSPAGDEGLAYATIASEAEGGHVREDDIEPLVFRNEDFLTVDELLEVYGVTPELYFGPGSPEAEYYEGRVGTQKGERFQIEKRRRRDDVGFGLRDYFTVYGNGALNMNTAPLHVLAALAEACGETDGDRYAERVIRSRRGGKDNNIDNDSAFKSITDLQSNGDVSGIMGAATALFPVGVTSTVFRIVSKGVVDDIVFKQETLVGRSLVVLRRDETLDTLEDSQERRDRNQSRTERRRDRNDESVVRYPAVRILEDR